MAQRVKPVTGLDIDPLGITATQVAVRDGLLVQRAAHQPLAAGIVREGEVADVPALSAALRELYEQAPHLDRRVRVGVSNQKVVVRTLELPPLDDPKELAAAVAFQAQDVIPMPLDQAVLDWAVLDVVETEQGRRQRVLLAAARRDMIDPVIAAVVGAGLRLEGIDVGAFGLIRALHHGADPEQIVLYADVAGITDVAIARGDQCLFARASGPGIDGVAFDLGQRCGLTLEHARGWLVHVGLEQSLDAIEGEADIVSTARRLLEDGVRRVAADLRQSVEFHQMQSVGASVGQIVLVGRAAGVPGFAAALGLEMGLPTAVAGVVGDLGDVASYDAVLAAGLAAPGLPGVSLIPEDRRRTGLAGRSGGAAYAVVGALALAVLLALVAVLVGNGVTSKEQTLADVTAQATRAERRAQALARYSDFSAVRANREQTVRGLATSRFDWAHALDELTRALPPDVRLTAITGSVSPGSISGSNPLRIAINAPAIELSGCTTSQARVADVMASMRRMDGVVRVALASSDKTDATDGAVTGNPCATANSPTFAMVVFYEAPTATGGAQ
ncbi:unannotated protein [freshwater metagenome]|uniref:Unannotated protein n=1 Tax=freshwater metagenome TaxID=449393 RepID=A0A6J7HWB2_9ZZZZ